MTQIGLEQKWWETAFLEHWLHWEEQVGAEFDVPEGIEQTLTTWRVRYRMPWQVVAEAIEITFNSRVIYAEQRDAVARYFCKVVWDRRDGVVRRASEKAWTS